MGRSLIEPLLAFSYPSFISVRYYRMKYLDLSGALALFPVLTIHLPTGYRFGAMLLVFLITSSKLSRFDSAFKEGGQINWIQVLFNGGVAAVLCVAIGNLTGWEDKCLDSKESTLVTALIGGLIGHYSCFNGDSWSSEMGIPSIARLRLITTSKVVCSKGHKRRCDGNRTPISIVCRDYRRFNISCRPNSHQKLFRWKGHEAAIGYTPFCVAGLFGSIIDSLLGATLQFSGFCTVQNKVVGKPGPTVRKISGLNYLDNNAVDLVSILLTTLLTSIAFQIGAGSHDLAPVLVRGYVLLAPFFGGTVLTTSEAEGPKDAFLNLELIDRFWRLSVPIGDTTDHPLINTFGPVS
ncbi:Integral membrane protein-like isoform 3 [Hibiscus syriacus]|uniref:Integral membrane protein-like isoform 3 n=1 Tax=Hibiscus syriacus TaxID=106335 RepID=A0A6A2XVV1_HIBSY|nr:Integral membrane protein-like isoform 3 [Hibiscus syriacus]